MTRAQQKYYDELLRMMEVRQRIYDELVARGVKHPFVDKGYNRHLLKSGWYFVEFNGNAEWLGANAQEAFERIDLIFGE